MCMLPLVISMQLAIHTQLFDSCVIIISIEFSIQLYLATVLYSYCSKLLFLNYMYLVIVENTVQNIHEIFVIIQHHTAALDIMDLLHIVKVKYTYKFSYIVAAILYEIIAYICMYAQFCYNFNYMINNQVKKNI